MRLVYTEDAKKMYTHFKKEKTVLKLFAIIIRFNFEKYYIDDIS